MKNNQFYELNCICEKFFKNDKTPFISKNILPLADLCKSLLSLDDKIDDRPRRNHRVLYAKTEILPSCSISICERFLEQIDPSLKNEFQKMLKNGTINLVIASEEKEIESFQRNFLSRDEKENFCDVNVGIYYNLTDPSHIIHEFFHGLNFVSFLSKKNYHQESETHRILTETISVYFEEKMNFFLESLGYDQEELRKLKQYRYIDTLLCSKDLLAELSVLDIFQRIGKISLENYRILKEYEDLKEPLCFEAEEDFLDTCIQMEKKLKAGYQPKKISNSVAYTLGVSLAFWCLNEKDAHMDEKILLLNKTIKNISSHPNIFENIQVLGIHMDEKFSSVIIDAFKHEMENTFLQDSNKKK